MYIVFNVTGCWPVTCTKDEQKANSFAAELKRDNPKNEYAVKLVVPLQ